MTTQPFERWLMDFAAALQLANAAELSQQRTLLINDVICTFVPPCVDELTVTVVLLDAGEISHSHQQVLAERALLRKLENFMLGAPLFFINPLSQHLIIGQKFDFTLLAPAPFVPLLTALASQALAWRQGAAQ